MIVSPRGQPAGQFHPIIGSMGGNFCLVAQIDKDFESNR
jgi:hypothetical protein